MQSKKTSEKNLAKIDFDLHFDLPKPLKITPTSIRDAKNEGHGRSLFRDAMDLARKPSQVNGRRRL